MRLIIFLFFLPCCFSGCIPAPDFYYQKELAIPRNEWTYNFKPSYKFTITDTSVGYQPFFLIRHTQAYPFNNLWFWLYIKSPGDSIIKKERINIVLAESSGKWLGRGMGEIFEQRMPLALSDSLFRKKGDYEVSIEQNMRINPLPEILNVGLRLEKVPQRNH